MEKTFRDRLIGTIVTMLTTGITFIFYSYVGSFETKASNDRKLQSVKDDVYLRLEKIESNQKKIICYLDKEKCL